MNAENRLRQRIRRVLSLAGLDQTQASYVMNELEEEILRLFREYSSAPEYLKDEVYERGEQRIFAALPQRAQGGAGATS